MWRALTALAILAGLAAAAGPPPRPRLDRNGDPLPLGALARLGPARHRPAEAAALADDGSALATASPSGLFVYGRDGRLLKAIAHPDTSFDRVAFSPGGTRLIVRATVHEAGGEPRTLVRLYDLPAGRLATEYEAAGAQWVGWAGDRRPVAVRLSKGALVVRDLADGQERRLAAADLPTGGKKLYAVACAPAANRLAFADEKDIVQVWDTARGRRLWALAPQGPYHPALALSGDGRWLASATRWDKKSLVELWDLRTGKVVRGLAGDLAGVQALAFSGDGKVLAAVGSWQLRAWDVATGKERCRVESYSVLGEGVSLTRDGRAVAAVEKHNGAARVWDGVTGLGRFATVGHTSPAYSATWSPDGRRVVSAGSNDGLLITWDAATGRPLAAFPRSAAWPDAVRLADGRTLFTARGDTIRARDADTGKDRFTLTIEPPDKSGTRWSASSVHASPDGRSLLALSFGRTRRATVLDDLLVTGFDLTTRTRTFTRRIAEHGYSAVSSDLHLLALGYAGGPRPGRTFARGPIRVEDLRTGALRLELPYVGLQTWPHSFSPDGRLLATVITGPPHDKQGYASYRVRLWELATRGELLELPAWRDVRLAFARDGRAVAVATPEGEVQVWGLLEGRERRRFRGVGARIVSLAFSPDGTRLVSGLEDGALLIWDVAGPKLTERLDARALAKAWDELAGEPEAAFAARARLTLSPAEAVPFLAKHLKPVMPPDAAVVKRLIAELDSDVFATRQKAQRMLEELGEAALGPLREALKGKPSVEVYRRVETLLRRHGWPLADAEVRRGLRGVAVLEDIGNAASVRHLEAIAKGVAGARRTEEAKAALARLAQRRR